MLNLFLSLYLSPAASSSALGDGKEQADSGSSITPSCTAAARGRGEEGGSVPSLPVGAV